MDKWFSKIRAGRHLSPAVAEELVEAGFIVVPGPLPSERQKRLADAYDAAMKAGGPPDKKIGSTTTRLYDFVNRGEAFDDFYLHPPLLEACAHVIGSPFKLSATLGRTLRPHAPAQDLHVDIEHGSEDLPMVGFILMVDAFRPDNGATRFVPGSHRRPTRPKGAERQYHHHSQTLACGPAGSLIVFNGSILHGHGANETGEARRSIQGYFVRREVRSGIDLPAACSPKRWSASLRWLNTSWQCSA